MMVAWSWFFYGNVLDSLPFACKADHERVKIVLNEIENDVIVTLYLLACNDSY